MHLSTFGSWIPATALLLALGSCRYDQQLPTATEKAESPDPATVRAVVQREANAPPGTVRYTVRVTAKDLSVAAYQGALTFLPGGFELVSVETAENADGEMRMVNTSEVAAGRIRFAAFATDTFASDRVFTVTFRVVTAGAEASVTAALDVVGTPEGAGVRASAILPTLRIE